MLFRSQFSGEEERSSGAQAEGGKAMESVGAKGCARFRADKKAVIRQARGVLRESRHSDASAVGFTVRVAKGIAWQIIMTSPSEGVVVYGTISLGRSDKRDR